MAHSLRDRLVSVLAVLATTLPLLLNGSVLADAILLIHNDSLTTYQPTAKTGVQDVRPLVEQRGTWIDGSLRAAPGHAWLAAGNPRAEGWNRNARLSGLALHTGVGEMWETDIRLPADVPWVISRSYNSRQKDSGGSYFASDGPQGKNWFQNSQPELVLYDDADDSKDMVYLVYGADRFLEFRRYDSSSNQFRGVNGAAGVIDFQADGSGPDLYVYYDQRGTRTSFFGFSDSPDIPSAKEGQIWKVVDPAGSVAYVGNASTASTALSNGYDSSGRITTAYDSAGRRFTYDYTSGRLDSVTAEIDDSGWQEVGQVEFTYYGASDSYGEAGDLETVTITTPLTDSGVSSVRTKLYRYYEGTYDGTNNPGYHHQLQYVIDFEGYRNYDWTQDSLLDDDPLTATEANIKPYAGAFFKYDTERRVVSAWFNGSCGCSGGGANGTHTFSYGTNSAFSPIAGYDQEWHSRVIVQRPDVEYEIQDPSDPIESYMVQYFDETGQPLSRVDFDGDPGGNPAPTAWATEVERNTDGQVTEIYSPANVTSYTHSNGSFANSTTAGLVTYFTRVDSSSDVDGFVQDIKHSKGTSGSKYLDLTLAYTSSSKTVTDMTVVRPFVASRRAYPTHITSGTTDSLLTSYTYSYWTGDAVLMPKQITTTNPAVSTSKNGSGSATSSKRYLRKSGSTAFSEAADGIFAYTKYTDGQLVESVQDAKTSGTYDSGDDPSTDWGITESGDGVHRKTTYAYDDQGRRDTVTAPDGRVRKSYYSKLADERLVALGYNDYDASPLKFYGPVQYSVSNHAGRGEVRATVSLIGNESTTALTNHVDETKSSVIDAIDDASLGSVVRLTTAIYDPTGQQRSETRTYCDLTNLYYDASFVAYDAQGRTVRTEQASGTVQRTDFDSRGRAVARWVGTNDNGFNGGDSSGTDNMVKTEALEYDSGGVGSGFLTKRTLYVADGATDKRETEYAYDEQGRMILQTNPTEPKNVANKYDNMGRMTMSASYKTGDGTDDIVPGDSPVSRADDRVAGNRRYYDEMSRVWKVVQYEVDESDGSLGSFTQVLTWYDEVGRTIQQDGTPQNVKTAYDRLGRQTHEFILAIDDDTTYAHADDVTGDIVLEEHQTAYESTDSDDVLMSVAIQRFHDDYAASGETTGPLDTNADSDDLKLTASNLEGRAQITCTWYDDLGRVTDTVQYGTYGGSTFDRDGLSVPARSDTALLTEFTYNDDGSRQSVTDPKDLETRFEYDDAGRQTAVIRNYVNGTPSGDEGDDDVHTRFAYVDGLRTKIWLDLDGDGTEDANDQVTTYTYGTNGGGGSSSDIATGHLLKTVTDPASGSYSLAYNAQGQLDYRSQEGLVTEIDFDDTGRELHRRATALGSLGLDDDVLRISTTYDNVGRHELITQYDNATVGSGSVVDEVKFTYDDLSNLTKFEQDLNSAVGASGSVDDYEVAYTYTLMGLSFRKSTMTLPDGTDLTYEYRSAGYLHDHDAGRVTRLKLGSTVVAEYRYNGLGAVVGTEYAEPDIECVRYGSTSGSYPDLDEFNRIASDRWTKQLTSDKDFFDTDITYDRNSNITQVDDNVYAGALMDYTMDDLNRLTYARRGGINLSITSHGETFTLHQSDRIEHGVLDLDRDGDYTDSGDYDDARGYSLANELTGRDTDDNGTDDFTLSYDDLGNLTDDGEHYEYVYDAFGRLRKILDESDQSLVAEYWYNGLGHRITIHEDTDLDDDVDSNDVKIHFVYDERWRIIATFHEDDDADDPKEQFVYHGAGALGHGGSSYIDGMVLRDRDANVDWDAQSDGVLEERVYYAQNWRADVVALVDDAGALVERVSYSAYGVPYGVPAGDTDYDGDADAGDSLQITGWKDTGPYDVRGDLDLDGDVDTADVTACGNNSGASGGWGVLSDSAQRNRAGYTGHEFDDVASASWSLWHGRARVLVSDLGMWSRRDPAGLVDGLNTYGYVQSNPVNDADASGLISVTKCNQAVFWCIINDPIVKDLRQQLISAGCVNPDISCSGSCSGTRRGSYDCWGQEIEICANNIPTNIGVCRTLAHEMVHKLDDVRDDPGGCPLLGIRFCNNRLCAEIRAYGLSGQCCPNGPDYVPGQTYLQCVQSLAVANVQPCWITGTGLQEITDECYVPSANLCDGLPSWIPPSELPVPLPAPMTPLLPPDFVDVRTGGPTPGWLLRPNDL